MADRTETTGGDTDIERFRDQLDLVETECRRIDPLIMALFLRRKAGENVDDELRPLLARFNSLHDLTFNIGRTVDLEVAIKDEYDD